MQSRHSWLDALHGHTPSIARGISLSLFTLNMATDFASRPLTTDCSLQGLLTLQAIVSQWLIGVMVAPVPGISFTSKHGAFHGQSESRQGLCASKYCQPQTKDRKESAPQRTFVNINSVQSGPTNGDHSFGNADYIHVQLLPRTTATQSRPYNGFGEREHYQFAARARKGVCPAIPPRCSVVSKMCSQ